MTRVLGPKGGSDVISKIATCPICEKPFRGHHCADGSDSEPSAGDWTLCLSCGAMLIFNEDLTARFASEKERHELEREDPETLRFLMRGQRAIVERDGGPNILAFTADESVPTKEAPCDRCGHTMNVPQPDVRHLPPEIAAEVLGKPQISVCTTCLPKATRELAAFANNRRAGGITFSSTWARSRRPS